MLQSFCRALKLIYGWLALVTLALGFVVFIMFFFSFLIGGNSGSSIAIWAGTIMTWGIRLAAVAIFLGLVYTYLKREHSLSIRQDQGSHASQTSIGQ